MSGSPLKLGVLHRRPGTSGDVAKLGPYEIETLIPEEMEGAATAYRVTIESNQKTNTSYHRIAEEIYYVLAGSGVAFLDGTALPLNAGDFLRLPPGVTHRFETADSSLVMLDIHVPGCRPNRDTYFVDQTPEGFGTKKA
jgi:mannose-6-phosphate isomerase-like protein (cupin superfamily)